MTAKSHLVVLGDAHGPFKNLRFESIDPELQHLAESLVSTISQELQLSASMNYRVYTFLVLIVAVVCVYRILQIGRRPKTLPPGPPTVPILGNIHQIPKRDVHLQFQKWAKEYGPIYSLILGTKTLIVLSSATAVKDLLDKRSNIYSDRQDMYIGMTLCSGSLRTLMMRYGPTWRSQRKMIHNLLNVQAAQGYVPYQMLENKKMLYDILHDPSRFLEHIRRYSNALTTALVFGWRTPTYENADLRQLFDGFEEFSVINQTGTAAMIDFFPLLRKLPDWMLPTQAKARQLHKTEKALYMKHWINCKQEIEAGTARPCFCVNMARIQNELAEKGEILTEDQACYISGTLLEAGSDTTSNTLYAFVQAILLFPEVQKRAQAEIDRVVGDKRLPTMEDELKLQYIRGCIKETLRWMPTTILGAVPHAVTRDDEYNGFFIPRGAGILNNVYTINHDPERYPNPRTFDPDRYRNDLQSAADAANNPDPAARDHFTFGAGRRICPGLHVAERSLFLGMSRLLWAFDIAPARDAQGNEIRPDPDRLTQGFVAMPEPFLATITPRSEERAKLVEREWREAQAVHLDEASKQWKKLPEKMK